MNLSKSNVKKLILIILVAILFYCGLQNFTSVTKFLLHIFSLFLPFVLGSAIAFVLNVPMRTIENKVLGKIKNKTFAKFRRVLAFVITLILLVGIIALAMFVIIPELTETVKNLVKQVPEATQKILDESKKAAASYPQIKAYLDTIEIDWAGMIEYVWQYLQQGVWTVIHSGIGVVSGAVNAVVSFFIAFVFCIYILFQKEKLACQIKQILFALLPERKADKILYIAGLSEHTFSNFLSGQCLEAVILGTLFFIAMSIFRLPYAVLVGVLIAITALIPIVGAFLGCSIATLLIVLVNPFQALIFLIMFVVLQQLEGNLIYPHVVGNSVGLPSIWVLAAVTMGGRLFGVLGMLVFIPLCSVMYTLFREFVKKQLIKKKISSKKWK